MTFVTDEDETGFCHQSLELLPKLKADHSKQYFKQIHVCLVNHSAFQTLYLLDLALSGMSHPWYPLLNR